LQYSAKFRVLQSPPIKGLIKFFNSYSEVSPSGAGVKIILKGKLPNHGCKFEKIEIYDQGRYFT